MYIRAQVKSNGDAEASSVTLTEGQPWVAVYFYVLGVVDDCT